MVPSDPLKLLVGEFYCDLGWDIVAVPVNQQIVDIKALLLSGVMELVTSEEVEMRLVNKRLLL